MPTLYSCFPSAVQVAAQELGLGEARPLTVTGGLTFGGGPLNNYVMHALARMAEVLRERPGENRSGNQQRRFITKHAFGVYSSAPPGQHFRHDEPQTVVDATPTREVAPGYAGPVAIESYTVMYGADGPNVGLARLPHRRRAANLGQQRRSGGARSDGLGGVLRSLGYSAGERGVGVLAAPLRFERDHLQHVLPSQHAK